MQSSDCLRRYWLTTAYLMLCEPDHTRLNHAVKWLFEKVLAVNCILDVMWPWPHQAESCSQVTVWEGTGCQLHTWCYVDLTTPGWIMQSSDCLRRYLLSTAYLMLCGPDHTRLNHAVKWLFEKVLAVNCILDVMWTWPHQAESCSQVTVWEGTGCQLHTWCYVNLTTPGWIMQSSDCLRRYLLSTAYLMLCEPDHTRLNHAVKWLFEKVLAVNCILDVMWTWPHQAESCSQVTVCECTGCQLHTWC